MGAAVEMIDPVPVILEPGRIAERLRFGRIPTGSWSADDLAAQSASLIRARAVFDVAYVGESRDGRIQVSGVTFVSSVLRTNLDGANKVFPYVITIGPELERAAAEQGDLLKQYYLEEIANYALEQAADWLARHFEERYGVGALSSLSPGSLEDWPITEQAKLFSIFGDTEKLVGVRLTESMLMIPRKSISGILFPSEEGFTACQLCERENCPGRKAPRLTSTD